VVVADEKRRFGWKLVITNLLEARQGFRRLAKNMGGPAPGLATSIIWPGHPSFTNRPSNWSCTSFHSAGMMILRTQIMGRLPTRLF
jgi:hypothetical protein